MEFRADHAWSQDSLPHLLEHRTSVVPFQWAKPNTLCVCHLGNLRAITYTLQSVEYFLHRLGYKNSQEIVNSDTLCCWNFTPSITGWKSGRPYFSYQCCVLTPPLNAHPGLAVFSHVTASPPEILQNHKVGDNKIQTLSSKTSGTSCSL